MDINSDEMPVVLKALRDSAQFWVASLGAHTTKAQAVVTLREKMETYCLCNWFEFTYGECDALHEALVFYAMYSSKSNTEDYITAKLTERVNMHFASMHFTTGGVS
jgi:hypothetical protein